MKKNIWFWASILEFAIIVCLIIFIFAFGTGMTNEYNDLVKEFDALEQANVKETATKAKKDEDTSSIENPSPNKDKVYKINEEAIIANEKNQTYLFLYRHHMKRYTSS